MASTTSAGTDIPAALNTSFLSAFWVWTPEVNIANPKAGDRAFRNTYATPTGKNATSALILIAVDDKFSLFVNGQLVGASPNGLDTWKKAQIFNVAPIDPRTNLFAIRATNLPDVDGTLFSPAGVLCAIQVIFSDGTVAAFPTDGMWKSIDVVPTNFESLSADDSVWGKAISIAQYGSGIWGAQVALPVAVPQQINISLPSTTASSTVSVSTSVALTSATSALSPSSSTGPPSSTTAPDIGVIVGSVIGGVATILIAVIFTALLKRQRKNQIYSGRVHTKGVTTLQEVGGGGSIVTPFPYVTPSQVITNTGTNESGSHWTNSLVAMDESTYQYQTFNEGTSSNHVRGPPVNTGDQQEVLPTYQKFQG